MVKDTVVKIKKPDLNTALTKELVGKGYRGHKATIKKIPGVDNIQNFRFKKFDYYKRHRRHNSHVFLKIQEILQHFLRLVKPYMWLKSDQSDAPSLSAYSIKY